MARRRQVCAREPKRCRRCFRRLRKADGREKLSEKSTMRRSQRLIATAVVIALSGALAGCSGGMSSFDPSDLIYSLDTKKRLRVKRKPVSPEGVPGLEQGVPKSLYKGSAQEQIDQQNAEAAAAAAAAPPAEEPKSKHAGQSKGNTQSKQKATPDTSTRPHRRSWRNRRNNPLRRSRRRCRAAPSRASSVHFLEAGVD